MGRVLAWVTLLVVGVVAVGWLAIEVFQALFSAVWWLVLGAAVVGGSVYLYQRARRSLAPGTRGQRRIEAAARTYRMRNR